MAMQLGRQVDNMLTDRFRETAALAGSELYSVANHGINGNLYDILTKNSTYKSPVFLVRTKDTFLSHKVSRASHGRPFGGLLVLGPLVCPLAAKLQVP